MVLVAIGGKKVIKGGNGLATGPVNRSRLPEIMKEIRDKKFLHSEEANAMYAVNLQKTYCFES